jgi:hypothetical protein
MVPLSAASNLPALSLTAEVKLLLRDKQLSFYSDGIAAQFTSINGKLARSLFSCSWCATSSFPVPLGVIKTRASVGATFSIITLI